MKLVSESYCVYETMYYASPQDNKVCLIDLNTEKNGYALIKYDVWYSIYDMWYS